jgi:hypothetical protein
MFTSQKLHQEQNGISENDMLLFDPCEDEMNQKWIQKQIDVKGDY